MGKIDASAFLQGANTEAESEPSQKQGIKVGKLNTSKLFTKEIEEEEENRSRSISVGKLKVRTLYQVSYFFVILAWS